MLFPTIAAAAPPAAAAAAADRNSGRWWQWLLVLAVFTLGRISLPFSLFGLHCVVK